MEETNAETKEPQDQQPQTVNIHKFERMQDRAEKAEAQLAELQKQVDELTAKQGTSETEYEANIAAMKDAADKAAQEAQKRVEEYEAQIARDAKEKELLKAGCIDAELGVAAWMEGQTVDQLKEAKPYLFKTEGKPSSGEPRNQTVDPEAEQVQKIKAALGMK